VLSSMGWPENMKIQGCGHGGGFIRGKSRLKGEEKGVWRGKEGEGIEWFGPDIKMDCALIQELPNPSITKSKSKKHGGNIILENS